MPSVPYARPLSESSYYGWQREVSGGAGSIPNSFPPLYGGQRATDLSAQGSHKSELFRLYLPVWSQLPDGRVAGMSCHGPNVCQSSLRWTDLVPMLAVGSSSNTVPSFSL